MTIGQDLNFLDRIEMRRKKGLLNKMTKAGPYVGVLRKRKVRKGCYQGD